MSKVYVHRNLRHSCWSVLERGRLREYRQEITIRDVEFKVRPGGYSRYLRDSSRNVHAFVVGKIGRGVPQGRGTRIRYDLQRGKFVDLKGNTYSQAEAARMDRQGRVWAFNLQT